MNPPRAFINSCFATLRSVEGCHVAASLAAAAARSHLTAGVFRDLMLDGCVGFLQFGCRVFLGLRRNDCPCVVLKVLKKVGATCQYLDRRSSTAQGLHKGRQPRERTTVSKNFPGRSPRNPQALHQ